MNGRSRRVCALGRYEQRGSESLSRVTEGNLGSVPLCGAVVGGAVVKARRACVCPSAGVLMISVEF